MLLLPQPSGEAKGLLGSLEALDGLNGVEGLETAAQPLSTLTLPILVDWVVGMSLRSVMVRCLAKWWAWQVSFLVR